METVAVHLRFVHHVLHTTVYHLTPLGSAVITTYSSKLSRLQKLTKMNARLGHLPNPKKQSRKWSVDSKNLYPQIVLTIPLGTSGKSVGHDVCGCLWCDLILPMVNPSLTVEPDLVEVNIGKLGVCIVP